MKSIGLKKILLSILSLTLLICSQAMATPIAIKSDSTKTIIVIQDSNRINKMDSLTKNINTQLGVLQEKTATISETVKTIDGNTNDGILSEGAKSFLFTFLYELFGYKSGSSTGMLSKLASVVSFLFLLLRIFLFLSRKEEKHPGLTKAINGYLILLAFFALLLPWTGLFFPSKDMDKEQILHVTENAKKLNDEVKKIQSADFTKLVSDIQELQRLRADTMHLAKESSIQALEPKLTLLQNQLLLTNKKLDGIDSFLSSMKKDENIAKGGHQKFQTFLMLAICLMVALCLFFISKK